MRIALVILAAGKASRMGMSKQLLPYKGATLLEVVINHAVNSKAHTIYCVTGAHSKSIKNKIKNPHCVFIDNPDWETGLSSSIAVATKHLQNLEINPDAVLFTLADQPFVDSGYIDTLISQFKKHKKIIASDYNGSLGVPALFPSKNFEALCQLKGDSGAKQFLIKNKDRIVSFKPKGSSSLIDIDTPEDFNNLINKIS